VREDSLPFKHIRLLGHGSLGTVDEVELAKSACRLARKSIRLAGASREFYMNIVEKEVRALKRLSHQHIVRLAGTYECKPFYAILMLPVGKRNLKEFLEEIDDRNSKAEELRWLKKWFVCLSSVLAYIHGEGVRHEDIKPSNIIHRGCDIFLTDFSSCTEFGYGATTSTESPAVITRKYCAPEALQHGMRHGLGSDIFSLGCVFAEMATVIEGRAVAKLYEFCSTDKRGVTSNGKQYYSNALDRVDQWFNNAFYTDCIKPMLAKDRKSRPTARVVVGWMKSKFPVIDRCSCSEKLFPIQPSVSTDLEGVNKGLMRGLVKRFIA